MENTEKQSRTFMYTAGGTIALGSFFVILAMFWLRPAPRDTAQAHPPVINKAPAVLPSFPPLAGAWKPHSDIPIWICTRTAVFPGRAH